MWNRTLFVFVWILSLSRTLHMGRKSYIPCVCHETVYCVTSAGWGRFQTSVWRSQHEPQSIRDGTTDRVANSTRAASVLQHVLHKILYVTVHEMYDLRRPRTGAECKFFSKVACATGCFFFFFFLLSKCASETGICRPLHMGRKPYIPCACQENLTSILAMIGSCFRIV